MPIFGQPSQLEADIEKATAETLVSENWPLIFEICDKVKTEGEKGCKDCVRIVLKRLQNKNQRVVYYTLILLETLGKNCGEQFILHISTREFCQEIQSLLQNKTQQPRVRNKLLNLIEAWNKQYGGHSDYSRLNELYTKLKNDPAVVFPDAATMATDAAVSPASIMTSSSVSGGGSVSYSSGYSWTPQSDSASNSTRSSKREDDDLAKAIALSLKESSDARPSSTTAPSTIVPSAPSVPSAGSTQNGSSESKKVRAMYDFEAAESNELTFKAGEIIILQDDSDENWWKGENHRGSGLFPAHFVTRDLEAPVPDVEEEEEEEQNNKSKRSSSVGFKNEVKVIEYSKSTEATPHSNSAGAQSSGLPAEIDADKIAQVLRYLETADPTGMSQDPPEMVALEAQCYGMGPLIDEQLNQLDQEHVKLSELNKKVIDALNMYHKLMEQSPAPQQPMHPSMTPYGVAAQQQSIPPAMNIQHPTYPVQGQPTGHGMPPQPVGAGIPNYGSYPGGAASESPANQEPLSVDALKQMNALNHHQQGDYSTAMQSGYGSLGAQGMPPQYGPSGVSGPQAQYAGQQAMATPHNMQPPSIQQTPQLFMSHQQQDPMQTSHSGMQAPIQ